MNKRNRATADGYGKGWSPAQHYLEPTVASDYDRQRFSGFAGRTFNWLERRLIRRSFDDLPRDCTIVDVPCGTGRLAEVLLDMGFTVAGLDISASMLEVASRRLHRFGDRFRPSVMDARELSGSGLSFCAGLCARVLMHFPLSEQMDFLQNVAMSTKRRVVFTHGVDTPYHRLRRGMKRLLGHQAPAVFPLTSTELRKLIASAGLREVRRYGLLPLVSESVVVVCEPTAGDQHSS